MLFILSYVVVYDISLFCNQQSLGSVKNEQIWGHSITNFASIF